MLQDLENDFEKSSGNTFAAIRTTAAAPPLPSANSITAPLLTSIEISAHYSCGTGYSPSIDPLRRHWDRKQAILAAAARRAPHNNT